MKVGGDEELRILLFAGDVVLIAQNSWTLQDLLTDLNSIVNKNTTVAEKMKLAVTQWSMERRMLGVSRVQRIRNNELRVHSDVNDIINACKEKKLDRSSSKDD
ncbi:unnamed protein product [Gongylonema pulchrum]|uniref:Reverse transcriptase domain-containing protein n=1 Tax=Gongylonema pulchrum TaxID=637853 RepID=A0A183ED91_9BILA|nr:unnamed protein product [Gongylonema pulchrum]